MQKEEHIIEERIKINTRILSEDLPQKSAVYFYYIRSLDFDEKLKCP